ncbi:MAG: hypothetical protein WA981_09240, partial [Glaciecola sp.]
GGPIALGFQLGCYIETQIDEVRQQTPNTAPNTEVNYLYSGYDMTFAGVVKPGDEISLRVKPGRSKNTDNGDVYSNRIMLMAHNTPVILGYKREYEHLPAMAFTDYPSKSDVSQLADRSFTQGQRFFVKHKYMIVGNAKNFLTSACAEQSHYIDEFEDKVNFPQMYPLGLISSALLERAQADNYDLKSNPMIYISHKLVIDKAQVLALRSNDRLIIVVSEQLSKQNSDKQQKVQHCIAYANSDQPLFYATVDLMPLSELLK